jgi:predicted dehydrogenase
VLIDRNISRAKEAAARFAIPHVFASPSEVDIELDLVSVCTPPFTHCDLSIESMQRGWHVLVEKPMAMSTIEIDRMIHTARETRTRLGVMHNFLFSNSMNAVDRMIADGKLGEPLHISILQVTNLRRHLPDWFDRLPGGLFFDEAPHAIYLITKFLPACSCVWSKSVAWKENMKQPVKSVEASFSDGERGATLTMIFNGSRDEWLVTVVGSKAMLYIDLFRDKLVTLGPGDRHTPEEIVLSSVNAIAQETRGLAWSGALWMSRRLFFGADRVINSFVDSILTKSDPLVSPEEGRRVIDLLCQVTDKCEIQARPSGRNSPLRSCL